MGRAKSAEVADEAFRWLLTQDRDEAEYFIRISEAMKASRRVVEDRLPMPVSDEITPHLVFLEPSRGSDAEPRK